MFKKILKGAALAIWGLFVLIQFVPYGRTHANPVKRIEPQWDNPQTRELARRACYDCHSNETVWPWYSSVAPTSWLLQRDVAEARGKLNFSEWDRPQKEAEEAVEQIQKGKMPLWFYLPLHPQARLSAEEKQALIRGLQATTGNNESPENRESDESSESEENEN